MSGPRSIAVGRDAVGNVLVTGDQNQIFILSGVVDPSSDVINQIENGTIELTKLKGAHLVDKPLVFVSYISESADWVNDLAKQVHEVGKVEMWLDSNRIAPGDEWINRISEALTNADGCLVCIGDRPPSYWQTKEIHQSLIVQEEKPAFKIVPILLPGGSLKHVPAFLKGYQVLDFNSQGIENAAKQITSAFAFIPKSPSEKRLSGNSVL